jgi:hypothetical protein
MFVKLGLLRQGKHAYWVHLMRRIFGENNRREILAGWENNTKSGFTQGCCRLCPNVFFPVCSLFMKILTSALVWDIIQRIVVTSYRSFGTTYRSQLQVSIIPPGPLKMWLICCSETSIWNCHYCCIISQKSADLIYIAVGTWNRVPKKVC